MKLVWLVLAAASLTLPDATWARTPERLAEVQREMRIVADVMKSVLRDELEDDARVTRVSAQYLARQGVLISVSLNSPWFTVNENGERAFQFDGQISIPRVPEIPRMVEDILSELEIDISPYEPQALEELRELRAEQRELRLQQRETRSLLRQKRRDMVRAESTDDEDSEARLDREIDGLEEELEVLEQQYEELSNQIDAQYDDLRDHRDVYAKPRETKSDAEIDAVIAQAACDYGATLRALGGDEFLTIALTRGDATNYYAFRMNHIKECSNDNMRSARLLELAYQYQQPD